MKTRMGKKIGRRGRVLLAVMAILVATTVVTASVLPYFGIIKTTATVNHQAVEIGEGPSNNIAWHPYNDPIKHTIPETSPGGETFCFKQWVRNSASIPVDVTFNRTDGWDEEVTTKIYAPSLTTTLILENKNADWLIIDDDNIQATLTFDTVANTFNYEFEATGLETVTNYDLIYYADFADRFKQWGGNNPGAFIATFVTDSSGNITKTTGSKDLAMNLPTPPDWNIGPEADYTQSPDYYDHANGAKIWLVPSALYNRDARKVTSWQPTRFLFETDLIVYLDCDKGVENSVAEIVGYHSTEVNETDPLLVESKQTLPFLICYKFDLHIGIGTYVLTTIVDATEHI